MGRNTHTNSTSLDVTIDMKAKMIKSEYGSPNGIEVNLYKKGEIYDLNKDLVRVFVDEMKIATPIEDKPEQKHEPPIKEIQTPADEEPPDATPLKKGHK